MEQKTHKPPLYPVDLKGNLIYRIRLYQNLRANPAQIAPFIAFLRQDIEHFFDLCLWTYDPRRPEKHFPFILYPFQREFVHYANNHIAEGKDFLVEKSRDMGLSYQMNGIFTYRWLFHSEKFLIGSRKENLVDTAGDMDTHFERLRYMHKRLFDLFPFLCPAGYISKTLAITDKSGGGIFGESMNEGFSRQGRYNAILLDEFAHLHNSLAGAVWTGTADASPCRIPASSVKGRHNTFADLRYSGKIDVKTIHWTKHPLKDGNWYEREKQRRGETELAQEVDISYAGSQGKPFYKGFKHPIHTGNFSINPNKPLILGWDYGYHHPCCIVAQEDAKGRLIIFAVLFGTDITIDKFGKHCRDWLNENFPEYPCVSYGDPAGKQKTDKSEKTSVEILMDYGFHVESRPSNTPYTNYRARKQIVEKLLTTLIDGLPALLVDDNDDTPIFIEAMDGGYCYPPANKFGAEQETPLKEGYYEHPMNAFEYIIVNKYSPITEKDFSEIRQVSHLGIPSSMRHRKVST